LDLVLETPLPGFLRQPARLSIEGNDLKTDARAALAHFLSVETATCIPGFLCQFLNQCRFADGGLASY
jgi:hypothetical protein